MPRLYRTCIIGIDVLDECHANINLDTETLTFPYLEGQPAIQIVQDETKTRSGLHGNLNAMKTMMKDRDHVKEIKNNDKLSKNEELPLKITWEDIK